MPWYKSNSEFYAKEMAAVRRRFPDVVIKVSKGIISLEGLFPVQSTNGSTLQKYHLSVEFPNNYPEWIPETFMLEPSVKHIAERHIESNGRACLCLPHEIPNHLPDGIRFEAYFDRLLTPWLIGQAYYDQKDRWPWPTIEHGKKGVLKGFSELLDIEDLNVVEQFAKLLVRKNPAKGHERCPCGSRQKLRDCHSDLYYQCRECLPEKAIQIYREQLF